MSAQPLLFEVKDFNSVAGRRRVPLRASARTSRRVSASPIRSRPCTACMRDLTHADNTEIEQELKLKQVPVTFTGRFLILPRGSAVEPYVGGGHRRDPLPLQRGRRVRRRRPVDLPGALRRGRHRGRPDRPRRPPRAGRPLVGRRGSALAAGRGQRAARRRLPRRQARPRRLDGELHLRSSLLSQSVRRRSGGQEIRRNVAILLVSSISCPRLLGSSSSIERDSAAFSHPRVAQQEVRIVLAPASAARRRLRRAPRSRSTRRTGADARAAWIQISPLPSCRKSFTAKPLADRSCM